VSAAHARLVRYAPVLVSVPTLAGVAWWASRQQVPALPADGVALRLLAAALGLYALTMLVRCERWHRLLVLTGVPSARADAYGLVAVGYMANNTLVARAGDVLKVVLTAGRTGAGGVRVAGLAVGERGFDALALAILFVVAGLLSPRLGFTGSDTVLRGAAIAGVAALALATAAVLARRTRIALAVRGQLVAAAQSMRPLAGRGGLQLLGMSLALWLAEAAVYLTVGRAVDVHLDLLACVQIVTLVNLVGLIPAAPANLGTFDAAVLFATRRLTSGSALAYVLVLRLVLFVPITLIGLVVLVTRHGGLGRLRTLRPLSSRA
jgi:glycosyltransferase 2 family protein